MARRARWWRMVQAAKDEALLAVELYNRPRLPRSFEGFCIHAHVAWLYLLHAELAKDGVDYRYWNPQHTRLIRADGQPKTWELAECVQRRWPEDDPVRANLEFFIGLRNAVEHRYQGAVAVVTAGHAQALLLNFELELVEKFGEVESIAADLRFPIFLQTFTDYGVDALRAVRRRLGTRAARYISSFHADLDETVRDDHRFEFRLRLVPALGPRSEADLALEFIRLDDVSDEEREVLARAGRVGTVIVREQMRPVQLQGLLKPTDVARAVNARIPFVFNMQHFVKAWKKLAVRPAYGVAHPERTDERYCLFDDVHRDYIYTSAFVEKLVRETQTEDKFTKLTGWKPKRKRSASTSTGQKSA